MNARLYTFVANHYLSPLQHGLQTAHVVGELSAQFAGSYGEAGNAFRLWAGKDKTIIICGAGNHQGVLDCFAEIQRTASSLGLPHTLFREDEVSMNGMATACGVVVPEEYWNTQPLREDYADGRDGKVWAWERVYDDFMSRRHLMTTPAGQFINHIKGFRLA